MKMRIVVGDNLNSSFVGRISYENKTDVSFLYVIEQPVINAANSEIVHGDVVDDATKIIGRGVGYIPEKLSYGTTAQKQGLATKFGDQGLAYMNYNSGGRILPNISNYYQYGITTVPRNEYVNAVSIYKKEIWYDDSVLDSYGNPLPVEEPNYHLVINKSNSGTVYDFNVGNNRYYKYMFRFIYTESGANKINVTESLNEIVLPIRTAWMGWTLTELHEVQNLELNDHSNKKIYTASLKDTWKFKYNISPGDYQQNLSKTKQDTLAVYPKFVHGLTNSISGQVSCLLGRDVQPFNWMNRSYAYGRKYNETTGKYEWGWQWAYNQARSCGDDKKPYYMENGNLRRLNSSYGSLFDTSARNAGGYTEELWPNVNYVDRTSNKQVDMLTHWQKFCYSGNPKLLRDMLGNRYIVQIHDTSSHAEEGWDKKPITITFSWTQIGDANDCQIIQEED